MIMQKIGLKTISLNHVVRNNTMWSGGVIRSAHEHGHFSVNKTDELL